MIGPRVPPLVWCINNALPSPAVKSILSSVGNAISLPSPKYGGKERSKEPSLSVITTVQSARSGCGVDSAAQ